MKKVKLTVLSAIVFSITMGLLTPVLAKGKAKKSASRNQMDATIPQKIKDALKIADTCKITFVEENESVTGSYKYWATI